MDIYPTGYHLSNQWTISIFLCRICQQVQAIPWLSKKYESGPVEPNPASFAYNLSDIYFKRNFALRQEIKKFCLKGQAISVRLVIARLLHKQISLYIGVFCHYWLTYKHTTDKKIATINPTLNKEVITQAMWNLIKGEAVSEPHIWPIYNLVKLVVGGTDFSRYVIRSRKCSSNCCDKLKNYRETSNHA